MKNLIKIIVLSNFLISMAHANSNVNGIYFGIGGALSTSTNDVITNEGKYTLTYKENSYKALVGKRLNDKVVAELQIVSFTKGDITINGILVPLPMSGSSFGVTGLYYFNSNEDFSPFVKLGLHSWSIEIEGASLSREFNGTDIFYGIGVDGKINETMKYRIEFESMDMDGDSMNNFGAVLLIDI
ncbi:hypothetical protein [uncultured Gammaproteobacteria bacterium]|jgi:hypothetical protein|nr:hypothetical protein [uncultured Gammaproteobacteria bacterium]CAC9963407.1 hypothetical protein [uncultured Gammaproteobacteria bacterium]